MKEKTKKLLLSHARELPDLAQLPVSIIAVSAAMGSLPSHLVTYCVLYTLIDNDLLSEDQMEKVCDGIEAADRIKVQEITE